MSEFKDFHNEKNDFFSENMVFFSQCNPNKFMNFNELLKITSDVAVEDFNVRGMSRDVLVEHGVAILVSRTSFRIHKNPLENQHYTLHTWEEKSEPLQFIRAYEITSDDGEKLISGMSSWFLMDLNARRLMPIKKFDAMNLRKPTTYQSEHDCLPLGKISVPDNLVKWDERYIKYTDMDGNGHTNNSRYGSFAVDAFPKELRDKKIKDFRLNYSREAVLDEKLEVFGAIDENEKKITVVGKTQEGISFEAEFFYQ